MTIASPALRLRQLATTAMLGVDRAPGEIRSPEKLLAHAAVLGAQARAGYRPRRAAGHVPECPAETVPVAGPAAMATLLRLLADPDPRLIDEWAQSAQARGRRVAEHAVPLLLDWWHRHADRRHAIPAVCGRRAQWLASLNPAWRKPVFRDQVPDDADEIWQTGKTPERLAVLLAVRKVEPARALALVRSTWADDGADERRRFVEGLADGLTMADEPFLEAALDDKSKVVRRAAAALLARLPGSRFKARMNARAASLIVVEAKKGFFRKAPAIALRPPAEFDKSWERDGLEEHAATGAGHRAWWLQQILGAADLAVWTQITGLDPAPLLAAIGEDDYVGAALNAVAHALESQPDAPWAAAVMGRRLQGKKVDPADFAGLLGPLPPADRQRLLLEAARHPRFDSEDRWLLLALEDRPWSAEFSKAALKAISESGPPKNTAWRLHEPIERISRVVSPLLAEDFVQAVGAMVPNQPTDSFRRSIDRVRLRADIHKEFAS